MDRIAMLTACPCSSDPGLQGLGDTSRFYTTLVVLLSTTDPTDRHVYLTPQPGPHSLVTRALDFLRSGPGRADSGLSWAGDAEEYCPSNIPYSTDLLREGKGVFMASNWPG